MTSNAKKRIVWSVSILVGLLLLLGFAGPFIQYKHDSIWICPVSGSTRIEIVWFGLFRHEKRTVTALEKWLKRKEPDFAPSWQYLATETYYITGRGYADARAPEINRLTPILDEVVENLKDERIAELVAVLRHGSPDEQRQMIRKISDEVLPKI